MHGASAYFLSVEQTEKLRHVLTPTIPIYPSPPTSSFPTLHITPKDFLQKILIKLKEHSIDISGIRLQGGAASFVLINDPDFVYRDIDILFFVNTPLSSEQQTTLFSSNNEPYLCDVWTIIKYIISSCLIENIPNPLTCTQYFIASVLDTYTNKNIKISSEQDSWALLSLQNLLGQNLELKFVENLKRQWQFSVDSFQIDLKPLLKPKSTPQQQTPTPPKPVTTTIQTKSLVIDAINSVTIVKKDTQIDQNVSISPLQFGFFTPSSSLKMNEHANPIQSETLASVTTIEASETNPTKCPSRSSMSTTSQLAVDDDQSDSSLQFQISINEDVDDGIEVDADDSTTEDDDHVYHTPEERDSTSSLEIPSLLVIEVRSAYKDLGQALHHLNNKLIATYEPETMRGGGLLKYCDLLSRNYKLYDSAIMIHMQRYMCSRFFIDYKTMPEQIHVIAQYVATHFLPSTIISSLQITHNLNEIAQRHFFQKQQRSNPHYDPKQIDQIDLVNTRLCLLFFENLSDIIHQSTVCLTHEDRELLLLNILCLKQYYHYEYDHLFIGDQQYYQKYRAYNQQHHCTNSSTNSSRSSSPSSLSSKSYGYNRTNAPRSQYNQRSSTNNGSYQRPRYNNQQTVQQQRRN